MSINSYTDLLVWQRSMTLVKNTYRATSVLPKDERFGLISQLRRSAISIPSNIAEGFGRQATGEYRHHLSISRGSLHELETQYYLCRDLGYLDKAVVEALTDETQEISRMLATLVSKMK